MAQGDWCFLCKHSDQVWPGVPVTPELSEAETEGSLGLGGHQSNSSFKERHYLKK